MVALHEALPTAWLLAITLPSAYGIGESLFLIYVIIKLGWIPDECFLVDRGETVQAVFVLQDCSCAQDFERLNHEKLTQKQLVRGGEVPDASGHLQEEPP